MEEEHRTPSSESGGETPSAPKLMGSPGGLYNSVKMSVKEANILSMAALALLVVITVLIVVFGRSGFTVAFDSRGGSDVELQTLQYGDTVAEPAPPTREGYAFTGWYTDEGGSELWEFPSRTVSDNVTLYAGWEPVN